jgi:hypothetical protein
MKSATVTLGVFAAFVAAQDLATCAKQCVDNMLAGNKAEELGCDSEDWSCLCQNPDFSYGFRDCARDVCGNGNQEDAASAVRYAVEFCSGKGVVITTGTGGDVTGSPTVTATGGDGSDGSNTLSTIIATVTSDGSEVTSTISTATLSGGNGDNTDTASTPGASNPGGGAGGIVTTITTGSEIITSTLTGPVTSTTGSVTVTETSAVGSETTTATTSDGDESSGTETESDGSASETGDSDDAGVIPTAAPGLLAAAGLVALLM